MRSLLSRSSRRRPILLVIAVLAALPSIASDSTAQQPRAIWSGRSGGFEVSWTTGDISARRVQGGGRVLSLRAKADAEHGKLTEDYREDPEMTPREVEHRYRVLSVVGPVVSVEEYWYCDCRGAHPISSRGFRAFDLSRGTVAAPAPARVTDYVAEADLLRALLADRVIRALLDSAEVEAPPRTLAALLEAVRNQPAAVGECTYMVGEDFLSSFAFHHVEADGRVAVRFSLSHHVEICRGMMTQIGVLVPASPRLRTDLAAARARTAGFLMADAARITGDRATVLNYQPKVP